MKWTDLRSLGSQEPRGTHFEPCYNRTFGATNAPMRTRPLTITHGLLFFMGITCSGCVGQVADPSATGENANGRPSTVGGPFENREFTYYGIPKLISATDTSPGWKQNGQKILLTGTVLQPDGRIPAPGILLYYYHTNTDGRYQTSTNESRNMPPNELGQTHGYIRGWVRTDSAGRQVFHLHGEARDLPHP